MPLEFVRSLLPLAGIVLFPVTFAAGGEECPFSTPVLYSSGDFPTDVIALDIDGDGDLDLISTSNTGAANDPLHVLLNDGTGMFTAGASINAGEGPNSIAVGDLDADGDLDLAVSHSHSHDVRIFLNNGAGLFSPGGVHDIGFDPTDVGIGDLDGDGDLDLAVPDGPVDQVKILLNDGSGSFTGGGNAFTGDRPRAIVVADFDGDGDLDLATANQDDNTISIILNNGSASFAAPLSIPVGVAPISLIATDLDNDGDLDLAVANWGDLFPPGDEVSILINDGAAAFATQVIQNVAARPQDIATADFNNDGIPDLVTPSGIDDTISVLIGTGGGGFLPHSDSPAHDNPVALTTGDFDGDGTIDVASANQVFDKIAIHFNDCGAKTEPDPFEVLWIAESDHQQSDDRAHFISLDAVSGGIYTGGPTAPAPNEDDFLIIKHDAEGNELWSASYNGTGDHYDYPRAMDTDADGNVYITGRSYGTVGLGEQWATLKYESDGDLAWVDRYDGGQPAQSQYPFDLDVSPNGEVAVVGWSKDANFVTNMGIVKYDTNGARLWERVFASTPAGTGVAQAVVIGDQGDVCVTGRTTPSGSGSRLTLLRYDSAGDLIFSANFDDESFATSVGYVVAKDQLGNIYAGGSVTASGTSDSDFVLIKYSPSGALLWSVVNEIVGTGYVTAITFGPDGALYASGPQSGGYRIMAVNPDGQLLWTAKGLGSLNTDNPKGHAVISADGVLNILSQTGSNLRVDRYDSDGTLLDVEEFDSGGPFDIRGAMTADANGRVYLSGYTASQGAEQDNFLTLALSITGFVPPIQGDIDNDGDVDFDDFTALLAAWGDLGCGGALPCPADLDNDGDVDFDDFTLLLANWT